MQHVFVHSFYIIFVCNLVLEQIEMVNVTSNLLTLFAMFYEINTEGTNFWIMLICVTFV